MHLRTKLRKSYFQHLYLAEGDFLHAFIILTLQKLLHGYDLPGVAVAALEHHPVTTLSNKSQIFIFFHQARACELHLHNTATSLLCNISKP